MAPDKYDTDHYLQFQSHQPVEHKMSVIRTLIHRADTIISDPEDKEREMKHLKKVLSVAGYSKWAWQAPGRNKIRPHTRNRDRAKGHVTLPYIGGATEPISRLIRKTGVAAHAKPHTTIMSILVAPKDKDNPQDKCGVVYQLTCHDCEASYTGGSRGGCGGCNPPLNFHNIVVIHVAVVIDLVVTSSNNACLCALNDGLPNLVKTISEVAPTWIAPIA